MEHLDERMQSSARDYEKEHRDARLAMRISLLAGLLMLAGKVPAYWITGSSAIFSDPAESVVHVIAVRFAAFSLWLSTRLAISKFQYGYERTYSGALNTILGLYLVRLGKRNHSLILEVDGKHVLVDSWTSFGVIAGLVLVMITVWKPFDPLIAIAVALNILWSGSHLIWESIKGLLDYSDPKVGRAIRDCLDTICRELGIEYHGVRFRTTGYRQMIEVHLLYPYTMSVGEAHQLATLVEKRLPLSLGMRADVITHLELLENMLRFTRQNISARHILKHMEVYSPEGLQGHCAD